MDNILDWCGQSMFLVLLAWIVISDKRVCMLRNLSFKCSLPNFNVRHYFSLLNIVVQCLYHRWQNFFFLLHGGKARCRTNRCVFTPKNHTLSQPLAPHKHTSNFPPVVPNLHVVFKSFAIKKFPKTLETVNSYIFINTIRPQPVRQNIYFSIYIYMKIDYSIHAKSVVDRAAFYIRIRPSPLSVFFSGYVVFYFFSVCLLFVSCLIASKDIIIYCWLLGLTVGKSWMEESHRDATKSLVICKQKCINITKRNASSCEIIDFVVISLANG